MIKIVTLLFLSTLFGEMLSPTNGKSLNYTHVLFEWRQVPDAVSYELQISTDEIFNTIIHSVNTDKLIYIDIDNINWQSTYHWRVRAIYEDDSISDWFNEHTFTTLNPITSTDILLYDSEKYQEGITFLGSYTPIELDGSSYKFTAAFDKNGDEIWNTQDNNIIIYNTNMMGEFYGCYFNEGQENEYPPIEFNLDTEVVWFGPTEKGSDHDLIQLPDGNYLSIVKSYRNMPVPYGPWYNQCVQTYGALVCDNYFNWRGDKIVIWDETTKEELWSWDTFDNYNTDDYDGVNYASGINGGNWPIGIINFEFDWTHINALTYVNNHNAIYLSSRHLSRLTKIYFNIDDYDDPINGEIIWNMGEDMPSGDVDCGDDLKFSWQHTISVLDNDNLVILDNGNLSDQYGGEDWPYGICECCNDNNPNNCSMELSSFLHDQFGCESSNECIIGQSPKFSSVPISRALEISPNEIEDGGCNAEIVWEHILDYELFGLASGGTQKLDNGNYLITTAGITSIGGVTQEVSESGQIVWEAKYNLDPAALQRAYRVSSLYPVSIYPIVKNFESTNGSPCILAHTGGSRIEFELFNNGREDEQFMCEIESIDGDWFTSVVETVFIKSGESEIVRFTGNIDNSNISTNNILITLSSVNNKNILKEYEYTVYPDDSICMSDADINFDSNVDIFDIITVSDYILYGDTFSADRECVIDLNDDMLIDIVDVLSIRNLILDS